MQTTSILCVTYSIMMLVDQCQNGVKTSTENTLGLQHVHTRARVWSYKIKVVYINDVACNYK